MSTVITLAAGSLKALVLLIAATGITVALRKRSARLRVVVWSTALAGSLLIPIVAPLLPPISLPLPEGMVLFDRTVTTHPTASPETVLPAFSHPYGDTVSPAVPAARGSSGPMAVNLPLWLVVAWVLGALAALSHLSVGLWRMRRTVLGARVVSNSEWQADLAWATERVGCRRLVKLLWSPQVDIPATVGLLRPALLLPPVAMSWDRERREAVLLHELIHVSRFDWPLRIVARLARTAYWFNPLAWLAVRRLDLEQELACDEEVVALGTRPSSYACHLLGIARAVGHSPVPAAHGLHFIRRSHLEERIMTILNNKHHRRAGLAVIAPAAILIAALVPALAAVAPSDPQPASPEIKQILAKMEEMESRFEPNLERIAEIEVEMEPRIRALEEIEIEIDHEAFAAIEESMEPYLERIAEIEFDMQDQIAQMEELEQHMQSLELHIEDGTLEDIERQIHEQLADVHVQMDRIHIDMEPFHEQMEEIHRELEPLHEELARIHEEMEPFHANLERVHESMEPFHEQMEEIHREMEPFHEEMEQLGQRLEDALRTEVASNLRRHLGAVTGPNSPFTEAAARITEIARIRSDDDQIRISAHPDETRQILVDLMAPNRIGTQQAFDNAIDAAVDSLSPMVISID